MRQRTEVPAGADRASQWNERNDAPIQHGLHDVDERAADAGMALQKRVEAREQRAAHDLRLEVVRGVVRIIRFPYADGVRQQQIALQLLEIGWRDRFVLEFA